MAVNGQLSCCVQNAHVIFFPQMQIEGQLHRGVVLSVTPQQAAVILELGACFNYCIISPPTLSLTTGENEGPEQLPTLNVLFYFFKILNIRLVLYSKAVKSTFS